MTKIFFDHQTFSLHRFGGVSRVFVREIEGLQKFDDMQVELGILKSENHNLINSSLRKYYFNSPLQFKGKTKLTYLINGLYSRFRLATNNYDIIHPTLTDTYFLPYLKKSKLVITIHDLVPILHPEMMGRENEQIGGQMRLLANKADHIVTISYASKADIIEHLRIPESKITVAHLGGIENIETVPHPQELPKKFILFDGVRRGYKNFERMINAIKQLLIEDEELYLVCMGKAFTDFEKDLFAKLKITEKVLHRNVPNDQILMYMFSKATVFIYPSVKEGFGIPILQAYHFGTTVAASDIAVFREVAGDQAFYFDPESEESIAAVTKQALNSQKTDETIKRKQEIAKSFTWEKHVNTVHNAYNSLI